MSLMQSYTSVTGDGKNAFVKVYQQLTCCFSGVMKKLQNYIPLCSFGGIYSQMDISFFLNVKHRTVEQNFGMQCALSSITNMGHLPRLGHLVHRP